MTPIHLCDLALRDLMVTMDLLKDHVTIMILIHCSVLCRMNFYYLINDNNYEPIHFGHFSTSSLPRSSFDGSMSKYLPPLGKG